MTHDQPQPAVLIRVLGELAGYVIGLRLQFLRICRTHPTQVVGSIGGNADQTQPTSALQPPQVVLHSGTGQTRKNKRVMRAGLLTQFHGCGFIRFTFPVHVHAVFKHFAAGSNMGGNHDGKHSIGKNHPQDWTGPGCHGAS